MCSVFANITVLLTWGPHMVYHGDPIYISYLYDQIWLAVIKSGKNNKQFIFILKVAINSGSTS